MLRSALFFALLALALTACNKKPTDEAPASEVAPMEAPAPAAESSPADAAPTPATEVAPENAPKPETPAAEAK